MKYSKSISQRGLHQYLADKFQKGLSSKEQQQILLALLSGQKITRNNVTARLN